MTSLRDYFLELWNATATGWNRFWFSPSDPATLGLIRILAGSMLLYTHAVWSVDLVGFFGVAGRVSPEFAAMRNNSSYAWSHLYGIQATTGLWAVQLLALACFFCLAVGLFTRITSVLSFLLTVGYAHRAVGALFGLDQINGMLALYLAIGPSGDAYSIDRIRSRKSKTAGQGGASISANIAVRLIQCHMCLIYLFAGLGKLLGETWWAGTALWGAFANLEYQTLDMTWVSDYPLLINLITHTILFWEVSYIVLIWPRLTRPLMLAMAIPLHLGIAVSMGMMTFGSIMLVGNLSFVPASQVRRLLSRGPRACHRSSEAGSAGRVKTLV